MQTLKPPSSPIYLGPCAPMPSATTTSSSPPRATPSPRTARRPRSMTSRTAPASASPRSIATSRRASTCSRPSTWRRSRPWPARPPTWPACRPGRPSTGGCTSSCATPPPSARWPRSCSPPPTPTATCSRPAAARSPTRGTRCSAAHRRRAWRGPMPRSPTSGGWWARSRPSRRRARSGRAHARDRARRPALFAAVEAGTRALALGEIHRSRASSKNVRRMRSPSGLAER